MSDEEEYDENGNPLKPRENTISNLGQRMTEYPSTLVAPGTEAAKLAWDIRIAKARQAAQEFAMPKAVWMRQNVPGANAVAKALEKAQARPVQPAPVDAGELDEVPVRTRDVSQFTRSDAADRPVREYSEEEISRIKKALANAKQQ